MMNVPPGIRLFRGLCPLPVARQVNIYRVLVLVLTFLAYTSYHLSRKPISVVKNAKAFLDCPKSENSSKAEHCHSWISQIDGESEDSAKTYLGLLDTSYLFSYAFFMFFSGFVAERVNLRYFLAAGMLLSGLFTFMFGLAYSAGIHSLYYFIVVQIVIGIFQEQCPPNVAGLSF